MRDSESGIVLDRFKRCRQDQDGALREQLILDHRWIAERCASRFSRRGELFDDLLQVAMLALVKAVDRFDPERGSTFPSYAMPTVMGELRRHFRDHTWPMSVPRRSKDLLTSMNAAIDALHQQLGRSPTTDEVAAALDVDRERVLETLDARSVYRPNSLTRTDNHSDEPVDDDRILGDDDSALQRTPARLSVLRATRCLDPRSRRILLWRFYEDCTQREIGDRLGIGQVQVSRLLRAALGQLRREVGDLPE